MPRFLLPDSPLTTLDDWLATEVGGRGIARARELGRDQTISEINLSGLRGRGGAGFRTGRKWRTVADQPGRHRYVACNGAEGEPATFKDRTLMRTNPYQLVEGVIVAAHAVDAVEAFICVKASFEREIEAVTRAVREMTGAGLCGDCTITIVTGPDEYLFGEEKAMLEVIEGKPPLPGLLPPFEHGLFVTEPQTGWESDEPEPGHSGPHEANPTLVNNVETLSNVPHILLHGAEWYRTMGTDDSPGNVLCTVVGDVARHAVEEVELGTSLRTVIERVGGGVGDGRTVKAVFSGVANPVVTGDHLDVPLSYESFQAIGSGMGAAGFAVYDDTACMVEVARQFSRFLYVESCGQCPPCKMGSGEITRRLARLEAGAGDQADVEEIGGWLEKVTDGNRCYLAVEEQVVVQSILRAFANEVVEHMELGRCPRPRSLVLPKLLDLENGRAVYDERQWLKQPDWTYAATAEQLVD